MGLPYQVSAPGKMMVIGEYAVLQGAPCVVAAVDVRVRLRQLQNPVPEPFWATLPPEASAARELAEKEVGAVDAALMLDVSDLRSGAQKLGVGSSAAAAAAAAGFVFSAAGHDLGDEATKQRVFECAIAGHRAVAPRGSGADVSACTLGGFVRFVRESAERATATPLTFPAGPVTRVVWTGKQVRTSDMLDRIEALRQRDAALLAARMEALSACAADFVAAVECGEVAAILAGLSEYGRRMGELGDAAGAPIVEQTLARIAALAQAAGGAAKPSGAGGGDVALAMFPDPESAERFSVACGAAQLSVLPMRLGERGVSVDVEEWCDDQA